MTHRGIEYSIRASQGMRSSFGREAWIWTFSPVRGRAINRRYLGTREGALKSVREAIDLWLERHPHAIQKAI
jgi:hypothetical protein